MQAVDEQLIKKKHIFFSNQSILKGSSTELLEVLLMMWRAEERGSRDITTQS